VKSSETPKRRTSPRLLLLAIVLLAVAAWSFYRASRFWWADSQLDAARSALDRADFTSARAYLQQFLSVRTDNPEAYFMLAQAARRDNKEEEAEKYYQRCQELGGYEDLLNLDRMMFRAQKGDLEPVEAPLMAFVNNHYPGRFLILESLVRGSIHKYYLNRALSHLERWLKEQPDQPRALLWKGETLIQLQRQAEAIQTFRHLVEVAPDNYEARLALGNLLLSASQPKAALEQFRPPWPWPLADQAAVGEAECQLALKNPDAAANVLDKLLAEPGKPLPEALLLRGKVEMAHNQLAGAERWFRQAVELAPLDRDAIAGLAECLSKQNKQLVEADRLQEKVKGIDRDTAQLKDVKAKILATPRNAALRCQAGEICFKIGQDKEGLHWLASALQDDPLNEETHRVLAKYYRAHGQTELALLHEQAAPKKPKGK
jgi:predicted Zn-dependent protease